MEVKKREREKERHLVHPISGMRIGEERRSEEEMGALEFFSGTSSRKIEKKKENVTTKLESIEIFFMFFFFFLKKYIV